MGVVTDAVIEVVAGVIGAVVAVLVLFPNKSPEKEALLSKVFSKDKGLLFLGFVYSGVCFLSSFFIPKLNDVAKSAGGPNKFPILDWAFGFLLFYSFGAEFSFFYVNFSFEFILLIMISL